MQTKETKALNFSALISWQTTKTSRTTYSESFLFVPTEKVSTLAHVFITSFTVKHCVCVCVRVCACACLREIFASKWRGSVDRKGFRGRPSAVQALVQSNSEFVCVLVCRANTWKDFFICNESQSLTFHPVSAERG